MNFIAIFSFLSILLLNVDFFHKLDKTLREKPIKKILSEKIDRENYFVPKLPVELTKMIIDFIHSNEVTYLASCSKGLYHLFESHRNLAIKKVCKK